MIVLSAVVGILLIIIFNQSVKITDLKADNLRQFETIGRKYAENKKLEQFLKDAFEKLRIIVECTPRSYRVRGRSWNPDTVTMQDVERIIRKREKLPANYAITIHNVTAKGQKLTVSWEPSKITDIGRESAE